MIRKLGVLTGAALFIIGFARLLILNVNHIQIVLRRRNNMRIKELREAKRLTQEQLAEVFGFDRFPTRYPI